MDTSKIVIVTGAAQGIGMAIAEAFAHQGNVVVIADICKDKGMQVAEALSLQGYKAQYLYVDLRNPSEIIGLTNKVITLFGRIDILVNNAGCGIWKSPYDLEVEEWDNLIALNLRAVFLLSREVARSMRQHGGGSIVNISSTRALMSEPNSEAYAASKGAVVSLTHALAASFAKDNIQVNCISPGWIETGDYRSLSTKDHQQHFSQRVGIPADIANACLFVTSQANNFISGTNLIIDGGMTKKMIYE